MWTGTVAEGNSQWTQALLPQPLDGSRRDGFYRRVVAFVRVGRALLFLTIIVSAVMSGLIYTGRFTCSVPMLSYQPLSMTEMATRPSVIELIDEKFFTCGSGSLVIVNDVLTYTEASPCYDWCTEKIPAFEVPMLGFNYVVGWIENSPTGILLSSWNRLFSDNSPCFPDACESTQIHFDWTLTKRVSWSEVVSLSRFLLPLSTLRALPETASSFVLQFMPNMLFSETSSGIENFFIDFFYVPIMLLISIALVFLAIIAHVIAIVPLILAAVVVWLPLILIMAMSFVLQGIMCAIAVLVDYVQYWSTPVLNYVTLFPSACMPGFYWASDMGAPAFYPIAWAGEDVKYSFVFFYNILSNWPFFTSHSSRVIAFFAGLFGLVLWILGAIVAAVVLLLFVGFWVLMTAGLVVLWLFAMVIINLINLPVKLIIYVLSFVAFLIFSIPLHVVAAMWLIVCLFAFAVWGVLVAVCVPLWPVYFMYQYARYKGVTSTCFRVIIADNFGNLPHALGPIAGLAVLSVAVITFLIIRACNAGIQDEWHSIANTEKHKSKRLVLYDSMWICLPCYAIYTDVSQSVNFLQKGQPFYFMAHTFGMLWLMIANAENPIALRDSDKESPSCTSSFLQSVGYMFFADVVAASMNSIEKWGNKTNGFLLKALNRTMTATLMNLFVLSFALLNIHNEHAIASPLSVEGLIPHAYVPWVHTLAAMASSYGDVGLITAFILAVKSVKDSLSKGLRWYEEEIHGPATATVEANSSLSSLRICEAIATVITTSTLLVVFKEHAVFVIVGMVITGIVSTRGDCDQLLVQVFNIFTPFIYVWPHKEKPLSIVKREKDTDGKQNKIVTRLRDLRWYFTVRCVVLVLSWLLMLCIGLFRFGSLSVAGVHVWLSLAHPLTSLWTFTKSLIIFSGFLSSIALGPLSFSVRETPEAQFDAIIAHANAADAVKEIDRQHRSIRESRDKATQLAESAQKFEEDAKINGAIQSLNKAFEKVEDAKTHVEHARENFAPLEETWEQLQKEISRVNKTLQKISNYEAQSYLMDMVKQRENTQKRLETTFKASEELVKHTDECVQHTQELRGGADKVKAEAERAKAAEDHIKQLQDTETRRNKEFETHRKNVEELTKEEEEEEETRARNIEKAQKDLKDLQEQLEKLKRKGQDAKAAIDKETDKMKKAQAAHVAAEQLLNKAKEAEKHAKAKFAKEAEKIAKEAETSAKEGTASTSVSGMKVCKA